MPASREEPRKRGRTASAKEKVGQVKFSPIIDMMFDLDKIILGKLKQQLFGIIYSALIMHTRTLPPPRTRRPEPSLRRPPKSPKRIFML